MRFFGIGGISIVEGWRLFETVGALKSTLGQASITTNRDPTASHDERTNLSNDFKLISKAQFDFWFILHSGCSFRGFSSFFLILASCAGGEEWELFWSSSKCERK